MDKATLLQRRIGQDTVEIPGVGTVTVRGLSRKEMLTAGKLADEGPLAMERAMLAFAMVDPALTEDEAAAWQESAPANEIQPVLTRINELSGVGKGAAKSGVSELRDES